MFKKAMVAVLILALIFFIFTKPGQNAWRAAFVIPNLLPENQIRPLEWMTKSPKIEKVQIPYKDGTLSADFYLPKKYDKVLLAIHGANEKAKDDPRIINFGNTFARSGFAVLIPSFPNISREKFTPEASEEIKTVYQWLIAEYPDKKAGMIGFSVAGGPMLIAAADGEIKNKVDFLISFGGYYELKEVLRQVTTGTDRDPFGHRLIDQQYKKFFGSDESLQRLLDNSDPNKFDELFNQLPPNIKKFVNDLSPSLYIDNLEANKVFVVHGDPDPLVPITESVRLHEALGNKSELTILKSFRHVNVRFAKASPQAIVNFYIPETFKLYSLIFKIINL
jgi:esterase/lipase